MRVSQSNSEVQNAQTEAANAKKSERSGSAARADRAGSAPVARDSEGLPRAEISSRAKEMSKAKDIATSTPDTREDKIAEIKRRIASGSYHVDADAVADRMVDEHLKTGIG